MPTFLLSNPNLASSYVPNSLVDVYNQWPSVHWFSAKAIITLGYHIWINWDLMWGHDIISEIYKCKRLEY